MSQSYRPSSFSSSCMPLAKFSFATVAESSTGPIPWVHISSHENLFAVFEVSTTQNASNKSGPFHRFRVLKDPDVLEDINLNILGVEAQRARFQAETAPTTNRNPSVLVVVKCPRIAIRYPTNGSQVRRFQVCFVKEGDYYEAMKILSQANVPTTEAGATPAQEQAIPELSTPYIMPFNGQQIVNQGSRPATAPQISEFRPPLNSIPPFYTNPAGNFLSSNTIQSDGTVYNNSDCYAMRPWQRSANQHIYRTMHGSIAQGPDQVLSHEAAPSTIQRASEISHVPSPAINFYVPRPSTAPTKSVREPEDGLPPRRELPFMSSPTKAPSRRLLPKIEPSSQPTPDNNKSNSLPTHKSTIASPQLQASFLSLDFSPEKMSKEFLQRQQASKTKAKKKSMKEPAVIANVDLQEHRIGSSEKSEDSLSRSQPLLSGENIDTQALFEKVEAKQKKYQDQASSSVNGKVHGDDECTLPIGTTGQAKRKPGTACQQCRNKRRKCVPDGDDTLANCQTCKQLKQECSFSSPQLSRDLSDVDKTQIVQVLDSQSKNKADCVPEDRCEIPPSTSSVQLPESKIFQASGRSKVTESPQTTCSGSESPPSPETETIVDLDEKFIFKGSILKHKQSIEQADHVPDADNGQVKEPTDSGVDTAKVDSNLQALLRDPNFAKFQPLELAGKSFSELPDQEQHDALQSYIISVIDSDEFVNLCKKLDVVWERVFLKC